MTRAEHPVDASGHQPEEPRFESGERAPSVDEALLLQFRGDEMQNARYTILVYNYSLGQFRIRITDREVPDATAPAGHGSIVQELCTYSHAQLAEALTQLRHSRDPLQLARSWAKPWNQEGGRIRLDNKEPGRVPTTHKATV